MNLIKQLAVTLLLPFAAFSQEGNSDLTYFVGKQLKPAVPNEQTDYKIRLSDLESAPYIQLIYKNHDYAVTGYTVSIMSRRLAKVVGQLKQQQGSLIENAARMDYTLGAGDRIFIDELDATCPKCTEEKNLTTKGLAILIE
jgi:hypothetical protein